MLPQKSEPAATSLKLSIRVATFLGAPIAGTLLLAANFRKLNQTGTADKTVFLGAISTIAVMVVAFLLPEGFPNYILPLAYTGIMSWIVKEIHSAGYDKHIRQGGAKGSNWRVAGIGFACLVGIFVVIFILLMLIPSLSV